MNSKSFGTKSNIAMTVINANLKVSDLIQGYEDNSETEVGGITSMNGRLNIRPRYQRAYVADLTPHWRENLINSILCGFPINRMYIGLDLHDERDIYNANLEMLDGQQRTKTICDFINSEFSIKLDGATYYFHNLSEEDKDKILNYDLDVTYCKGTEDARIAWFKRINQPNAILTPQELRNATYIGPFLEASKKFFCAPTSRAKRQITDKDDKYCAARYSLGRSIERCEYLELALDWISYRDYPELRDKKYVDDRICRYMAQHQHDENADELIAYYKEVIDWVNNTFPVYQKCMTKVEWGRLYVEYGSKELDLVAINKKVDDLMLDSEVTANSAVYEYVLMGCPVEKDSMLVLRNFQEREKEIQRKLQKDCDPITTRPLGENGQKVHAHHILPWREGGKTELDNLILINEDTHIKIHNGMFSPCEVKRIRDEWEKSHSK